MSDTNSDTAHLLPVYKSCGNNIVTLKIDPSKDNDLSRKVDDDRYATYRCKRAYVVSIVNKDDENQTLESIESDYNKIIEITNSCFQLNFVNPQFVYKVGEWVEVSDYDGVSGKGIYFYKTKEAAWHHNKDTCVSPNFTGRVNFWRDDGQLCGVLEYHLGILRKEIQYNEDDSVSEETEYDENGKLLKQSRYFPDRTQTVTHHYKDGTNLTFTLPLQSVQPNPSYGKSFISSFYRPPIIHSGFGLRAPMVMPSGLSSTTPMVMPSDFAVRAPMVMPSSFGSTTPMVMPSGLSSTTPMVMPSGLSSTTPMVMPSGLSSTTPMVMPSSFGSQQTHSGVQFQRVPGLNNVVYPNYFTENGISYVSIPVSSSNNFQ
jgi:hypothetical protein